MIHSTPEGSMRACSAGWSVIPRFFQNTSITSYWWEGVIHKCQSAVGASRCRQGESWREEFDVEEERLILSRRPPWNFGY